NVTRADMIAAGWSPSVRLFEAGACATPIVSDRWEGIDAVFAPDREIVLADSAADVIAALDRPAPSAAGLRAAARAAVLAHHSAERRAQQLESDLLAAAERLGAATASRRATV